MVQNEKIAKQVEELNAELSVILKQISESVSKRDLDKLHSELDHRISISNDLFLKEVSNISLISVTAAPFSLTLLLSGLEIEKTFLVIAFIFLMINVIFLNIGIRYLSVLFKNSTVSQKLQGEKMRLNMSYILDETIDNSERVDALYEFLDSENKLNQKKIRELFDQEKILSPLRDLGFLFLSVGIIYLILSVVWAIFPFTKWFY